MKLYYVPRTSAGRPRWMLEEIGEPYELVVLDPSKGETHTPEHLRLHPLGHVPVLVDGELTMFESSAIVQYLADRFPDKGLAPPVGTPARGLYYQWFSFAMTEMLPNLLKYAQHTTGPEDKRVTRIAEEAQRQLARIFDALEAALAHRPYILGEEFCAADIAVGSAAIFAGRQGTLGDHPRVAAYVARLLERPAWKRATSG